MVVADKQFSTSVDWVKIDVCLLFLKILFYIYPWLRFDFVYFFLLFSKGDLLNS
jgi:hypothetical protein